jgi:hypothetical protein
MWKMLPGYDAEFKFAQTTDTVCSSNRRTGGDKTGGVIHSNITAVQNAE